MCPQLRESRENPGSIREHLSYGRCSIRIYSLQGRSCYSQVSGEEGKTQRDEDSYLKSKWAVGRAGLKVGQVRLPSLHPRRPAHGTAHVQLWAPLLTAPHTRPRLQCTGRLFIGSQTAGQMNTEAPGRPSTALDTGSSAGGGQGGFRPQNGPWLTQHHVNTELKTS